MAYSQRNSWAPPPLQQLESGTTVVQAGVVSILDSMVIADRALPLAQHKSGDTVAG